MYKKIAGLGLLTVFAMMIFPSGMAASPEDAQMWGTGTIVLKDSSGEIVLENTIHNRIVNEGETYVTQQLFRDGTVVADTASVSTICLYEEGAGGGAFDTVAEINIETATADNFDSGNAISGSGECQVDATVVTASGLGIVSPPAFTTGDVGATDLIAAIAVCTEVAASIDGFNYNDCGTGAGVALAIVDTADVTLGAGGSVTVTYTFDFDDDAT